MLCFKFFLFVHFFRFSPSGGGQQCCYNGNALIVGPPGGGTIDLVSPEKDKMIAHFQQDVLPWFYCCKHSDNCEKYYQRRPSDDGSRYVSPIFGKDIKNQIIK